MRPDLPFPVFGRIARSVEQVSLLAKGQAIVLFFCADEEYFVTFCFRLSRGKVQQDWSPVICCGFETYI